MLDDHTTMFTAISVALESLTSMIDDSPQRVEMGYARAATVAAQEYLERYLETRESRYLKRANEIMQEANKQMQEWEHHV